MRSVFATRRVFVRLTEAEAAKLIELARAERRHPGDQAGVLLSEALKKTAEQPCPAGGGAS